MGGKKKLARCNIPHAGEECVPSERLIEFFHGDGEWTAAEATHLRECDWCTYFALHGYDDCPNIKRLFLWAKGEEPTRDEWHHLAECPACAEDYQQAFEKAEAAKNAPAVLTPI